MDENVPASWLSGWDEWLREQIDRMAEESDLETPPVVRLSEPTRSLVPMVQERAEATKATAVSIHRPWNIRWKIPKESQGHVCSVCGVRLNGDPTNKGKPCEVCRNRRHHRRDDWLHGRLGYDTIWFEEVADANGRLVVLTLSLDLEPWLAGERVDSLRAQAIPEWRRFNPTLRNHPNPIDPSTPFESLFEYIRSSILSSFNSQDPVFSSLQDGFRHEKDWPTFFQKIVEDRAAAPRWNELSDDQRAAWLAHQFFCKLPSPGRVYRFWREAVGFFEELLREFRQIASRSANPWRVRRLLLCPDDSTAQGWQDGMLYDGRWRGVQISLVYVGSLRGFVTASNLARLLKPEERKEALRGETISLEEEDAFGSPRPLRVKEVKELKGSYGHLGVYYPVIPLEISPLRFRVILPLGVVSECVDLAVSWWQERFARVWDRLPLRVGVVGFPRALSFQAVVEAVRTWRRLSLERPRSGEWRSTGPRRGCWPCACGGEVRPEHPSIYPSSSPRWSRRCLLSYVEVEDQALRYPRDFQHPGDGRVFRHIADLRVGDGIGVAPATVVTLWMESTATRFEPLKARYLEDWTRMREIWHLVDRIAPSTTALQRLRSAVTELQTKWRAPDGSWVASEDLRRDTFRALLAEHLEVRGAALETLVEAAMEDLLSWALDWHLTALRERP